MFTVVIFFVIKYGWIIGLAGIAFASSNDLSKKDEGKSDRLDELAFVFRQAHPFLK